ncbi:MAG: caspase family protein [bacterium]|nr:caspase family protein [bacterium]
MKKIILIFLAGLIFNISRAYSIDTVKVSDMEMVVQKGHSDLINSMEFSPDGKYIVSSSEDNTIKLWGIDGKLIKTLFSKGQNSFVSIFNKHIISTDGFSTIQIWDFGGTPIKTIKVPSNIAVMRLSPDKKYVVCATWKNTLELWSLEGIFIKTFIGHSSSITGLSFSPDGKYIVSGSRDKTIKLWAIDGKLIRTFEEEPNVSASGGIIVQFSPDGKYICSIGKEGRIKIWAVNGSLIKTFGEEQPDALSFSPDGKHIASIDLRGQINIWNLDGVRVKTINTFNQNTRASSVVFSPDGKYLACKMFPSNTINLWSTDGELIRTYGGIFPESKYVAFSSDGKHIVSAAGAMIKIWSNDGKLIRTLKGHKGVVYCVMFSYDNDYIISGSEDGTIRLWNKDGKLVRILTTGVSVIGMALSPDGKYIAAGTTRKVPNEKGYSWMMRVELWNIDGKHIRDFEEDFEGKRSATYNLPESVSFSHDGKYIAALSYANAIILWSLDGTSTKTIATGRLINRFSFSPDEKHIIVDATTGNISNFILELWSIDGKLIKSFKDKHSSNSRIQISPNGKYIVSISGRIITLWSIEGDLIKSFEGHQSTSCGVSFSPDSKQIVSSSSDGTVKIWNIETGDFVSLISPENSDEWIMYTPDGYFDASKNGGDLVAMVKNDLTAYGVDQFAIKNNRPDIILKRLGLGNETLINHYYQQYKKRLRKMGLSEEKLLSDYQVPLAEIIESKQEGKFLNLSLKLSDNKYNLKRYNIYINDVPIFGAYGKEITGNNIGKTEIVELTSGKNKIEVTCINEAGAESFRALIYADYKENVKGDLYYIGFGISKYKNKDINLKYAHKDVLALGNLLAKMKNGFNNVHIKTYINEEVTIENIKNAKEFLKNAKVDDTFILFIAGHGVHDIDEEETYYYLTYGTELKNLKNTAADFESVEDILQGINPRKKVFLIDACESGEVDKDIQDKYYAMADSRGLKARTTRGIKVEAKDITPAPREYLFQKDRFIYNDLMRRSGAIVFSSSRGGEFSYEKDEYQNGLFTKAILNSLTQKDADKNNDGIISTDELREYVSDIVPKISENLQHPTVDRDNIYQKFGFQMVKLK